MAHLADDGSLAFRQGIANLKRLLTLLVPDKTILLSNYPNPFNPDTWIPYHLGVDADVTVTIYNLRGELVRQLDLGLQEAGYYVDKSRAAYWDGTNEDGESVASGVYFYKLDADEFTASKADGRRKIGLYSGFYVVSNTHLSSSPLIHAQVSIDRSSTGRGITSSGWM